MIYLDNAATTFPKPESVYKAIEKVNRGAFNSGRGSYKVARESTLIIDNVRQQLLDINNIKNGKVVFTPSATVSLNDLIFGIDFKPGDNIYISPFEHNSVIRPLEKLREKYKLNVIVLPFFGNTWYTNIDKIKDEFALKRPKCVILSHISNATGYVLPYQQIFEMSMVYNSVNILDSAQGYGIVKIKNLENINYIVFAGHKSLYSCFGIAGYIKLKDDTLNKRIFGGTGSDTMNPNMSDKFPDGYEAGSPNIVAISGLHESINWLMKTDVFAHEKELTNYLIEKLKDIEKCVLYLPSDLDNIFGIVSFNIEGYLSNEVGKILDDEFDICVRTGYHCAPLIHGFISSEEFHGTVRVSLSYFNTKQDIDNLVEALKSL